MHLLDLPSEVHLSSPQSKSPQHRCRGLSIDPPISQVWGQVFEYGNTHGRAAVRRCGALPRQISDASSRAALFAELGGERARAALSRAELTSIPSPSPSTTAIARVLCVLRYLEVPWHRPTSVMLHRDAPSSVR